MADPPWDIHMELPYGTMADDEMRKMNVQVNPAHERLGRNGMVTAQSCRCNIGAMVVQRWNSGIVAVATVVCR